MPMTAIWALPRPLPEMLSVAPLRTGRSISIIRWLVRLA